MTDAVRRTDKPKLTVRQIEALIAARDKGGAVFVRGSRMGGAKMRMVWRLVEMGLLYDRPPYPLTVAGFDVLGSAQP